VSSRSGLVESNATGACGSTTRAAADRGAQAGSAVTWLRAAARESTGFYAKADATTGREIWRTYLDNVNVSGHWIAVENLNILPNGNVVFAWSTYVALLDGDTGRVLRTTTLPEKARPIRRGNVDEHL
jgi:outer membrane protein assembly factor BamB